MMKMAPSSLVCILSWMFSPDRRTGTIYSWPPSPRATLLARNQGKGPRLPFEVLSQRKLSLLQPVLRRQGHLIEKLFARNCSRWLGQHIITYRHHNYTQPIHPKSESPGCPDSAIYLNLPQNYSQTFLLLECMTQLQMIDLCSISLWQSVFISPSWHGHSNGLTIRLWKPVHNLYKYSCTTMCSSTCWFFALGFCRQKCSETKTRFGSAASSWHFHLSSFCTWRSPIVGASKPWHPERNKRLRLLDVVASPAEPEPPLVLVGQLVGWLIMKWNPNIWCSVAWASLPT